MAIRAVQVAGADNARRALTAQWWEAQEFVAEMAEDLARRMRLGAVPPLDGADVLDFFASVVRELKADESAR